MKYLNWLIFSTAISAVSPMPIDEEMLKLPSPSRVPPPAPRIIPIKVPEDLVEALKIMGGLNLPAPARRLTRTLPVIVDNSDSEHSCEEEPTTASLSNAAVRGDLHSLGSQLTDISLQSADNLSNSISSTTAEPDKSRKTWMGCCPSRYRQQSG